LLSDQDVHIERSVAAKLDGINCDAGFVKPGTTTVIARSNGYIDGCRFNGQTTFDVDLVAEVCRPYRDDHIIGYEKAPRFRTTDVNAVGPSRAHDARMLRDDQPVPDRIAFCWGSSSSS
jgi:hypothetical protein